MEFSIIIAVRNEINYIKKCIKSVFNQDYKGKYEVIVVDGMSDDGTYEILQDLKKKHNFQLLRNPTLNAAAGRNTGIKESKGKHIAFIDGDAVAAKNWLSQIKTSFEKYKVAGVGGPDHLPEDSSEKSRMIGYVMTSPLTRGGKLNPSTQHSLMEKEKFVDHIPTCNLCLKREVFDKIGLFDEKFVKGQDLELNYRVRKAGYKILYSPKIEVVHYRKQHIRDFARQIFKWAKAKIAIIKKHGMHGLISHIYLWPAYFSLAFSISLMLFYLLNIIYIFIILLFLGVIFYSSVLMFEAAQLSKKYKNKKLFLYAAALFPIVHISYSYGVFSALIKRKIW